MAYNHYFGKAAASLLPRKPDATLTTEHHPAIPDGVLFLPHRIAAMQKLLLFVDRISTWVGQAFSCSSWRSPCMSAGKFSRAMPSTIRARGPST